MKVGIMGGTFDPIHLGHLIGAEQARIGMGLDKVWFLPNLIPPHKDRRIGASPEQRMEMVRLAIAGHPAFRLDDTEIRKGGVSYTIDTARVLTEKYPEAEFYFIIGADMVNYLPQWYRIDELAGLIRFIGLQRPGVPLGDVELPEPLKSRIHLVPMPPIGISSTDIRERIKQGISIRYLVPEPVFRFIEEHDIYEH